MYAFVRLSCVRSCRITQALIAMEDSSALASAQVLDPEDSGAAWEEIFKACAVPDSLQQTILSAGFETPELFSHCATRVEGLDPLLQTWLVDVPEPVLCSVEASRIRLLWLRCQREKPLTAAAPPAGGGAHPEPLAGAHPETSHHWGEIAPPRLSQEAMHSMITTFRSAYPGEILDQDTLPSVKLWSTIHQMLRTDQSIRWVPWQLRLSQKAFQEKVEARHSRQRAEMQWLSHLMWEDAPELPVDNMSLTPNLLHRTQTLVRNAFVLSGGSSPHFQVF